MILYLFKGANWTHDANTNCKIEKSIARLAKVQNEALENELYDCKAECRASDGCLGFIQKPNGVCINLKFVDESRCATDQEGFNLFYNGEYVRFALYRLPGNNIANYPIACKVCVIHFFKPLLP